MNGWLRRADPLRPRAGTGRRCWAFVASWLLALVSAAAPASDWRERVYPDDRDSIEQAMETTRTVLRSIGPEDYGHDEVAGVQALLDARAMDRPADRLLGDWRCRSIQLGEYGLFSYPYFRCHIEQVEGGVRFRKASGSQRRTGSLHADGEARWVFIGSSHCNDDPVPDYSGLHGDGDGEDRERDSVGVLETLADGRLRMLLDVKPSRVEIYELIR